MDVFLVEPSGLMRRTITRALRANGVDVRHATPEDLLAQLHRTHFDILLARWSDGSIDDIRHVRNSLLTFPIVLYAGAGEWDHTTRANLFIAIADQLFVFEDPIDGLTELLELLRALHRRRFGLSATRYFIEELEVDLGLRSVRVGTRIVSCTASELLLLARLAASSPKVVTKNELASIFPYHVTDGSHALKQLVHRVRKKLGPAARYVRAVAGVGYRLATSEPLQPAPAPQGR